MSFSSIKLDQLLADREAANKKIKDYLTEHLFVGLPVQYHHNGRGSLKVGRVVYAPSSFGYDERVCIENMETGAVNRVEAKHIYPIK